jgi:L-fuculose-phosphate aldolase
MNEYRLRESVCEVGRRLDRRGFVAGCDGNVSARLRDGEFLCTPTRTPKCDLKPEDLCVVDPDGRQLCGPRDRTSEILMHLAIYRHRPDVRAVVHAHPPHATAFAIAGESIPNGVLPEVEFFLGVVPTSPYVLPGTQEFADSVVPYLGRTNTLVLASHGTVSFGPDLKTAHQYTEYLDAFCCILLLARPLGGPRPLSEEHVRELLALKRRYGLDDVRLEER